MSGCPRGTALQTSEGGCCTRVERASPYLHLSDRCNYTRMKLVLGDWFGGLVEKTCIEASRWLPKRIITRGDNSPYLARYYIFRKRWLQKTRLPSWVSYAPSVYLHHFLRGDDEKELHNHPYGTSLAFVLFGGYMEQRRDRGSDSVGLRVVTPGKFNYLRADDFHKITLLDSRRGPGRSSSLASAPRPKTNRTGASGIQPPQSSWGITSTSVVAKSSSLARRLPLRESTATRFSGASSGASCRAPTESDPPRACGLASRSGS